MEAKLDPLAEEMKRQLETLGKQRAIHQEAIASLDGQIALVRQFLDAYAAKMAAPTERAHREGQADLFADRTYKGSKAARSQYVAKMMDEAEGLIRAAGRPLTRSQLLDALTSRGFSIQGGDQSKVLGTNLWRSGRFWSLKGLGYWPVTDEIPDRFKHVERRPGAKQLNC